MSEMRYADVAEGVRAAIAAYAQALDDGRTEDVVATFCPDGSADIPGFGSFTGHDALRAAYAKWTPRKPQRHVMVNTNITSWSQTEATATTDLLFLLKRDTGWGVEMVGRYHDRLSFDGSAWRFLHRTTSFD